MKNETRSMLNEFGVQNFNDQIGNVLVNFNAEKTKKCWIINKEDFAVFIHRLANLPFIFKVKLRIDEIS